MIPILTALVLIAAADPPAAAPPSADVVQQTSLKLRFRDPRLTPVRLDLWYDTPAVASGGLRIGRISYRPEELSRTGTTLKGLHMATTTAALLGAMNLSYDLWDDDKTPWLIGGAAALGALYGGTLGYGNDRFRIEARVQEE